jgi:hypothetical protein
VNVSASSPYGTSQVIRAFAGAGIKLMDAGYGTATPVAALQEIRPRHAWTVGVYVYADPSRARQSFRSNVNSWRASGVAVQQLKNVLVTAVFKGFRLGSKARPQPMPRPVVDALATLTAA